MCEALALVAGQPDPDGAVQGRSSWNPDKLSSFMGKMLGEFGAALNSSLVMIGDKLGLYRALSAKGPLTPDELARATTRAAGRTFAASTVICTPASLDQEVGMALGAKAGEARLRDVAQKAGLKRFRRATETAFNLILEARV